MKSIVGIFGGYGKFVAALRAKLPVGFAGAELQNRLDSLMVAMCADIMRRCRVAYALLMTVNQSSRFMAVQFVAGQVGALLLDVSYFAFKLSIAALQRQILRIQR